MLPHVFGHDERCPACVTKRWVFDVVLGPWRVLDRDQAARLLAILEEGETPAGVRAGDQL